MQKLETLTDAHHEMHSHSAVIHNRRKEEEEEEEEKKRNYRVSCGLGRLSLVRFSPNGRRGERKGKKGKK